MFWLIRCCSSFTPGLLKPSLNPRGRLNSGFAGALFVPVLLVLVVGFLKTLIVTSAF